jgi:aminoglycoside phosphotransferase (APT) family kinase protein
VSGERSEPKDADDSDHPDRPYLDFDSESLESVSFSPPPPQTVAWVEAELRTTIDAVEPLPGGLSSAVHLLTLADEPHQAVLRRYTNAPWLEREPHIPDDEARNLRMLGSLDLGVRTPTLLATDVTARRCDVPAIVMAKIDGRPDIDPAEPTAWAERLARCLAGIHSVPPPPGLPPFRRWDHPDRPLPSWTSRPELWTEALAIAAPPLPTGEPRFLHRDFHPCNIHWADGEICGVVDWLGACVGSVAGDLAHCRWNLAMLAGIDTAEHFTAVYRDHTGWDGDRDHLLAYDLATVLSGPVGPFPTDAWNALGRSDLTSETVAVAVDGWLAHLLAAEPAPGSGPVQTVEPE